MRHLLLLTGCIFFIQGSLSQEEETDETPLEQMSGKQIYATFCSRCHGDDGRGDVPRELIENMEVEPPDLTEPYFSSREKRKDWRAVVAHGGGARGLSMAMPAWGEALSELQIHETIEYIKSFVDQERYPQGELNFVRGHTTTKAFVEQEALLIPTYRYKKESAGTASETSILFYYANRFGNRFQYEVKLPLLNNRQAGSSRFGVGDLELGVKYAFYDNFKSLTIVTIGMEAGVPTGDEIRGFGAGTIVASPYLAAAQGVGNFLQLSTCVKIETPLDKRKGNPELHLSILSLFTFPEAKQGLFPGLELFTTKDLGSVHHTVSLIPQLYWGITTRGHLAISLGAEIPVAGDKTYDGAVRMFVAWDFVDGGLWW